jgi:glycosyltransferase involved in cell wall biosynthesis
VAVPTTPSPAASGRRTLPLLWCGALTDPSGYADEARSYILACERAGLDLGVRQLTWTNLEAGIPDHHAAAIRRAERRRPEGEHVLVYHLVPGPKVGQNGAGPTVLRTMFETDRIPDRWHPRLAEMDEIWVPCTFNAESFAFAGVPREKLRTLPETIDFDLFRPSGGERPPGPFTFLTSFDFTDRKGWDILLDAWVEAFDPEDDVRLVLKCLPLHVSAAEIVARVERHLGGRACAPIELNPDLLPTRDLPRLYEGADAFVLASRGEGWGRPYMEAMAMGLPTIGSRWSGNLEFMHDGNSWLVDGEVVPVAANSQAHTPLYAGHSWFQPDGDSLVAAFRAVAAGGPEVAARAAGARDELLERFGPEPIAARLAELADGALARWRERRARPHAVAWRGDWGSVHSLAVVNEALAGSLERCDVRVARRGTDATALDTSEIGVAQHWPPVFDAPSEGPFVLYQPWEFGEIPAAWVEPIRHRVDEVWTPSEYSRQSFLEAGLAPDLVHVVPNGVDLERFGPDGPARRFATTASTVFLFVGGTTYRKGLDLLLEAYGRAFTAADDVCLVVKGFGATTVYRDQSGHAQIEAFRARPGAPELLFLDDDVPYDEVPALYRGADCLVQPYRGEGFCLPALEGLACGLPVIVTAGGPTDDFTSELCAWQVPSRRVPLPAGSLPEHLSPAGGGFLLEPGVEALAGALREAADPAARAAKAAWARPHAERCSWAAAADRAAERIRALAGRTPIRRVAPAALAERRRVLLAVAADWSTPASWAPAVRAYGEAFDADADVTLVLPGAGVSTAELVERELAAAGLDPAALADIVLAESADLLPEALELAADAFVATADGRPLRARRIVAPDPAALRSLLETA